MEQVKYVMIIDMVKTIIIFPGDIIHSIFLHMKPISAGFIRKRLDDTFECYGESTSLKLKSHPEDSDIANSQLGNLL